MIFSILALYLSALPDSLLPLTLRCALLGAVEITTGIRRSQALFPLCRSPSYHSSRSLWWDFRNLSDKKCTKKVPDCLSGTIFCGSFSTASFPAWPLLCAFHKSKPADRYLISLCFLILHSGRSLCILLFHNPSGQLIAVGRNNIIAGLHGTHKCVKTPLCVVHGVVKNGLQAAEHIIRILNGALSDIIGVIHCGIYDCLSLDIGL